MWIEGSLVNHSRALLLQMKWEPLEEFEQRSNIISHLKASSHTTLAAVLGTDYRNQEQKWENSVKKKNNRTNLVVVGGVKCNQITGIFGLEPITYVQIG